MATFKKVILSPGVYHAPQGKLHATPGRVRGWARTFKRMQKNGIRVPICWGHQPGAIPGDGQDKSNRQYELSRFNAGYIRDMQVASSGALEGVLDIPGADVDEDGNLVTWAQMPDGRKVRCAIKEVSAAIRDWKDGKGRDWPDAIMHVALVPLPVVAGQEGFEASLGTDTSAPGEIYLSLSTYLGDDLTEGESMPMIEDVETPDGGMDSMAECLSVLEQLGLPLPADTDESNFCERVRLIGGALVKLGHIGPGAAAGAEDAAGIEGLGEEGMEDDMGGEELPLEDEGVEDEFGEEGLDEGEEELGMEDGFGGEEGEEDEDGEAEISGDSDGLPGEEDEEEGDEEDATEEPRPVMMGTKTGRGLVVRTPLEKAFAKQVKTSIQKQRLARVDALAGRGLPKHRIEALRRQALATPVDLMRKGSRIVPVESRVDIELSTLEGVADAGWVSPASKGKVTRARRPEVDHEKKVSKKFIEESADAVSVRRRK